MFTLKLVGKSDNPGNWSAINGVHTQQVVVASNFRKKKKSLHYIYIYIYKCTPFLDRLNNLPGLITTFLSRLLRLRQMYICV